MSPEAASARFACATPPSPRATTRLRKFIMKTITCSGRPTDGTIKWSALLPALVDLSSHNAVRPIQPQRFFLTRTQKNAAQMEQSNPLASAENLYLFYKMYTQSEIIELMQNNCAQVFK